MPCTEVGANTWPTGRAFLFQSPSHSSTRCFSWTPTRLKFHSHFISCIYLTDLGWTLGTLEALFIFLYMPLLGEVFFRKDFIYLFSERGEGKEIEWERNINVWLPLTCPLLGTWPTTQACALIGNWTSDPLVRSLCSIHWTTPARAGCSIFHGSAAILNILKDLFYTISPPDGSIVCC